MALKKLVAGNWKMHGMSGDIAEIEAIARTARDYPQVDVALCVPAILIERAARAVDLPIGGQDVHFAEQGAHTGCISAKMLRDAGAKLTIVGHSERRDAQRESDEEVKAKAEAALACGLDVILCIGESLAVREAGSAVEIVCAQLAASLPRQADPNRLAIAYEPIWAIGTGKIPTMAEIAEMHAALRRQLQEAYGADGADVRILYGGSVKASNASEIFAVPDVDGALVGGASLKQADFIPIVAAAAEKVEA
ncbi:triose-phosphate isomerase [Sphingomonas hankyongi]|uniref:Triosephosphate isomerase n=1 Tax=Sphingomonas hankyongi TaxID=2908209 RepID=A0ABT0S429_9SPHN|nr:triose-phosphate isomerase [Sphingomonas hankyongi]MCL6730613.1 triose-phosphate isomerase [Sphingomonas hankyongi]